MDLMNVFSIEKELGRLNTQNRLMYRCEQPIFREYFAGKSGLRVLDVGSNDGEKTVRWFSDGAVAQVLGLEYNAELAQQAQERFGDGRFSFRACDAEAEDFPERLSALMAEQGLDGFDVIYLSYVLCHLRSPAALLRRLRPVLRAGGLLVAVESDDGACALGPEGGELYREYLEFFAQDPYCGDRSLGRRLPELLRECGYPDAVQRGGPIVAGPDEPELREHIFHTYDLLTEDLPLLREHFPNDALYDRMEQWLDTHREALKRCFLAENARAVMGITVVTSKA